MLKTEPQKSSKTTIPVSPCHSDWVDERRKIAMERVWARQRHPKKLRFRLRRRRGTPLMVRSKACHGWSSEKLARKVLESTPGICLILPHCPQSAHSVALTCFPVYPSKRVPFSVGSRHSLGRSNV